MYKHVLVPISFGEDRNSDGAIDVARLLADEGGRITLLHVVESVASYAVNYLPADYAEKRRLEIEVALGQMVADIPNGEGAVATGHASRAILDWSDKHDVDCVVIASHRPGMQDLLLGSTAAKVVRHSKCAVHVLR
ncbi:universal stress protein [Rhodobacteraceae bacterium KMM 6894]|nr:universal stress protein [Rhodobacteraceae bacterium KMM 6894]